MLRSKPLHRLRMAGMAGMLALFPFQNLIDPLGLLQRMAPTAHLEHRWKPVYAEPPAPQEISFQWLGTCGFKVQKGDFVLLIDPYLTRMGFPQIFFSELLPDQKLMREKITKADYIFITESHFDHFLDAPAIALHTGAKVVGPPTAAKLLRMLGLPEGQIIEVQGGEILQAGPFQVQVAKAEHGNFLSMQLFHGDVDETKKPPLTVWDYRSLENRCYRFTGEGISFFATSGSDVNEADVKDFASDVVIANVTALVPGYIEKLMRITKPAVVFPTHYDNFFEPFAKGVQPFPILDLQVFCDEIVKLSPEARVITLDFFQEYRRDLAEASPQAASGVPAPALTKA